MRLARGRSFRAKIPSAGTSSWAPLGLLGALAVTLAAVGIRMLLGAARGNVPALVLRQALPLIGAGLGIGLAASLLLARLPGTLLFEVVPG